MVRERESARERKAENGLKLINQCFTGVDRAVGKADWDKRRGRRAGGSNIF